MTAAPTQRHGRILHLDFIPHPALPGAHLQTILPALLRPSPDLNLRIEDLDLPDGDFVELGWAGSTAPQAPIAVLLHGLGGSFDSKYLRGLGRRLAVAGWRVCAMLQRGGGRRPNRLARIYNHGDSEPVRHLLSVLRRRHPDAFIAAVGWSLGGNVLLKALGEAGTLAAVDRAYAVSVPFRLRDCAEHLRRGFARVYQGRLLDACKALARRQHSAGLLGPRFDLEAVMRSPDFFVFDDLFTAPLSGYRDAEDYYARAACGGFLTSVRIPTTIIHAADDPFMTPDIVPPASALSESVTLELSLRGGHVGFIGANRRGLPICWLEQELALRLQADHVGAREHRPAV